MSTGDLKNNLRKLTALLKQIKYQTQPNYQEMAIGLADPFLPILHHVFDEYSRELGAYLLSKGYDLFGKTDARFLEVVYKILVQEFHAKPLLTKQQFFSIGFAEVKVIFVTKILSLCVDKNKALMAKSALKRKQKVEKNKQVCFVDYPPKPVVKHTIEKHEHNAENVEVSTQIENIDISKSPEVASNISDPKSETEETSLEVEESPSQKALTPEPKNNNIVPSTCELLDITLEKSFEEAVNIDEEPLPHVTVTNHNKNDYNGCRKCEQCLETYKSLAERVDKLEALLNQQVSLNSALNARVSIMDAQLKLLQTSENDSSDVHFKVERISNVVEQDVLHVIEEEQTPITSPMDCYIDDEELIRNFKPIRINDLYSDAISKNSRKLTTSGTNNNNLENERLVFNPAKYEANKENIDFSDASTSIVCYDGSSKTVSDCLRETEILLKQNFNY